MRVGDFLVYMARLKGVRASDLAAKVTRWLERVDLAEFERKRCEELSKGMQQKVQFIAAVIHQPDLLVLDEPFSGLDPVNSRLLRDLVLEEHRRGATILFSTHIMTHAEQLCDHVVMIHRGRKVLDQTVESIGATFDPRRIVFEPLDPSADVQSLRSIPGVSGLSRDGGAWDIALAEGATAASVIPTIVASVVPSRIEVRRPSLEDVFVSIVSGTSADAETDDERLRAALRDGNAVQEVRR
jgi:ABC-2 type transport system ATP-binding protein